MEAAPFMFFNDDYIRGAVESLGVASGSDEFGCLLDARSLVSACHDVADTVLGRSILMSVFAHLQVAIRAELGKYR